jgi:hypothetical protein
MNLCSLSLPLTLSGSGRMATVPDEVAEDWTEYSTPEGQGNTIQVNASQAKKKQILSFSVFE